MPKVSNLQMAHTAMAFSALLSCDTPTMAFSIRIVKITIGSTNAVKSSPPSTRAKTKEITAETNNMMTSWSLNCSSTNFHNGVGSSSGSAISSAFRNQNKQPFIPYFERNLITCRSVRPVFKLTLNSLVISSISRVHTFSITLSLAF
jgi:hypothetical protein